ncbi:chaperonin HSP60 [Theileria orientalis strain Shintoku]|uniref:Chaperonin HSP60 n=1 Tax=Theileria orientalis strain Shintoku TaxID=869250 RepID=J7MH19_THEOR|nr:chaperonin HSP60 [Theileria orientalis strain Shintoku]BAM42471.1 chaperonin HSP60 [Theileria orientalis strain Shintoku]|eukprot:XP_009692772.1 chaperonin HSP60 [Theileria orientalis strain Shintoku]
MILSTLRSKYPIKNPFNISNKIRNIRTQYRYISKEIRHGTECRQGLLSGCNQLVDAVSVTLGPKGRNVIISSSFGPPKITKDGVTVAKSIELPGKLENMGAQLIKQVSSNTNDKAGDGTTTAAVLARAIFKRGCKLVDSGLNPMDLLRGINVAIEKVTGFLDGLKKEVTTDEEILNVATISANGDQVVGKLITDAMNKVGKDGTITVAEGKTLNHELEVVEGIKWDRGYISPHFVTNVKDMKVEFDRPYVLLCNEKVSNVKTVLPILEHVLQQQAPLLIVSEDVDGDALAMLIVNKLRLGIKVCAVKAPGFGEHRKATLLDIAEMTGATALGDNENFKQQEDDMVSYLGRAKSVTVTKDHTIIVEGMGDKARVEERCEGLRSLIKVTESEYERDKLKERLARLTGGVAIIKVGGASEVEVNEVKDRVEDALCATKAAVEGGIVPGGGTALFYASKVLDELKTKNYDQKMGVDIVRQAIQEPMKQIATNAGYEGSVIADTLMKENDHSKGFNAQTGKFCNMFKEGILDPTKVVKTALTDAASVASLMTTSEVAIFENKAEKNEEQQGNQMY